VAWLRGARRRVGGGFGRRRMREIECAREYILEALGFWYGPTRVKWAWYGPYWALSGPWVLEVRTIRGRGGGGGS
jgi:hypothetical protein